MVAERNFPLENNPVSIKIFTKGKFSRRFFLAHNFQFLSRSRENRLHIWICCRLRCVKNKKIKKKYKKKVNFPQCVIIIFFLCVCKRKIGTRKIGLHSTFWQLRVGREGKLNEFFLWIKGAQIVVFNKKEEKCPQDNCRRKRIKF